jgi:glycosyltransferase involved in cell wall biosynthesis
MITVITPVFNGAQFIRETVESVLEYKRSFPVEYIVVNDGSTDSTFEILQEFSGAIRVISKPNGGESSAVNVGIENSKGSFLLVVSADDPLPSSKVFSGVEEFFSENPDVVAWYPNWAMIDSSGKVLRIVEVDEYSEELLIGRFRCLPGPGTIFRKDAALSIGGRDSRWTFVGDYDFWLRLSRVGILKKRDELVAQWRFHSQSTSISLRGLDMAAERISVTQEFLKNNSLEESIRKMALAHSYYFAARLSFFDSKVDGKRLLRQAFASNKWKIEDGNALVYSFIWTLPFSRLLVSPIRRLLQRMGYAQT